ncbi:MAG: hypothetical protein ACREBB_00335 [Nitrosotalea sp.]
MLERSTKSVKKKGILNTAGLDKLDDRTTKELAWIHSTEIIRMMGFQNNSKYSDTSLSVIEEVDW